VAQYCKIIAKDMGYSSEECEKIHQAGILHDIGKIATPDVVLLNPQSLNDLEYKLIQEHVRVGYRLLVNIPMFKELAEIVYAHHERFDGKGYPKGLEANEITPLARIMMVADAFDAMTTNRVYKGRKTLEEALAELVKLKSIQFHPEVVDSALKVLKNICLDDKIDQIPHSEIEEERFAYFYKDTLGNNYNQNYLDVVLMRNSYEKEYKYMYIFYLKHFSKYNKKYSWSEGDKLLHSFAESLHQEINDSLVFRVFGDDFVVLSRENISLDKLKPHLDEVVESKDINYQIKTIDLGEVNIDNTAHIESI